MPKIWRAKFERGIDFDIERGQRSHTCPGEKSAGKQAVETAAVAPGDHATFTAQGDAARRPAAPAEQLGADAETEPDPSSALNWAFRLEMTKEVLVDPWVQQRDDLRPILETARDTISLFEMGSALAACDVPQEILRAIRIERLPRQMEVCEEMLSAQTWSSKCPRSQKPPAPFLCTVRTADEPGLSALPLLSSPSQI